VITSVKSVLGSVTNALQSICPAMQNRKQLTNMLGVLRSGVALYIMTNYL